LPGERQAALGPVEFEVFSVLVEYKGRIVDHNVFTHKIWGEDYDRESGSKLRTNVQRIRNKLAEFKPHLISVPQEGYQLVEELANSPDEPLVTTS